MYNREFPSGNFLFFFAGDVSLLCLPRGKLALAFLAVPAGLVNDLQNHITLCIIGHLLQLVVE